MAERSGEDFLRVLRSALRLSERAISRGGSLNTPPSRSSASLRLVTSRDQVRRRCPPLRAGCCLGPVRLLACALVRVRFATVAPSHPAPAPGELLAAGARDLAALAGRPQAVCEVLLPGHPADGALPREHRAGPHRSGGARSEERRVGNEW